jgi:peptidoglycan/xylan/chitin deacetylase (PgdA/CDA1 family)/SAM-dependent methyltransferase
LKVEANRRYVISFLARSDKPRRVHVGFAKGQAPWSNLGLYSQIDITPDWQSVEREFEAQETYNDARIHFDVGGGDASVELSSLKLRSLTTGEFIVPDLSTKRGGSPIPQRALSERSIPLGKVDFGSLRRLTPISLDFGCDRGRPVDRYYIENFLTQRAEDVRGRVLEIGENTYTRRFGGDRVTTSDVLHVVPGEPQATIIADLATADHIPTNSFDCIILTQTLQLIYDVRAAVSTIYRILRPGGVLLATFPGISQTYDNEWGENWCWNFTKVSARRLFEEGFGAANVTVESFGNVMSAISFLHGLADEELTREELDYLEPGYEVTIAVRAVKPTASGQGELRDGEVGKPKQVHSGKIACENSQAIILMYHRVAEGGTDPFSLCVAPNHFAEQLEVLRKSVDLIGLRDFIAKLENGGISRPTAVITFDDGYADNLLSAKPLLERHDVPATVFIATGYIGGHREFWWDELDRLLLQPSVLPQTLRLTIEGTTHEWDLGDAANYSAGHWQRDRTWIVSQPPPTARHATFFAIWSLLQILSDDQRQWALGHLRSWAGVTNAARSTHRPLSANEIVGLVRDNLIEAGAHTVTHPVLSRLPVEMQKEEIQQSIASLEEIIGRHVPSFAYPFGSRPDFTDETADIVRSSGCICACSTVPNAVENGSDRFRLPRFQVDNWDGGQFSRRLWQWMS